MNIDKIINLIKKTNDKVIIVDENNNTNFVLMPFSDYEKIIENTDNFTNLNEKEFLNFFKTQNCYLDDICLTPIDNMANNQREQMLQNSVVDFSNRLREYKPKVIIVALRKIIPYATEAISLSGIEATYYQIPFAGNGHQNKYITELTAILKEHLR